MADDDAGRRYGFESKLAAEADAVLSDTVFRRSPVLSKLLRYLVNETTAGQGDILKSYAVAVDGLGRSESFDSASDSSARVQMVRLRKSLESHYAQHAPVDEHCLYLQPGSYRVRLGRPDVAYPMLYRPLAEPQAVSRPAFARPHEDAVNGHQTADTPIVGKIIPPRLRLIGGIIVLAILMLVFLAWLQSGTTRETRLSPVLELMPVDNGNEEKLEQAARIVSSSFSNDLPRFKLARIRVIGAAEKPGQPDGDEEVYRLFSRIEQRDRENRTLFLTINDARSQTTLWSQQLQLPADGNRTYEALTALAAEINGPFGIIATHGSQLYENNTSGGYPCLLKYFAFVRSRENALEEKIAACLERPVKEQRLKATMFAARALFAIERNAARRDFPAAAQSGIAFARQAIAADPNDGASNYVMARLSYFQKDCVTARYYTTRAVELNPNSPIIISNLAALAPVCAYTDAAMLLDRAFLTQSPLYNNGRLLLVLAAIAQNRPDRIAEIQDSDPPQSQYNRINYYLAESLIAASQGRRADAARNWQLFSKATPPGSRTADEKLKAIVALPLMRKKLVEYLAENGALEKAR
jgi:hypothetical protein